jgi:acyl-CoA synthetase (AMP-forming)/AMP-acid ligase II
MNLGRYISRSAKYYRDTAALIFDQKRITYEQLDRRTNRLARGLLGLGLQKGDRVAIYCGNRPEIAETEVACYKAGLVRVPINARLSPQEATGILNNSEAKAIVVDALHLDPLLAGRKELERLKYFVCLDPSGSGPMDYEELLGKSREDFPEVEVELGDLAVLTYSSGTTGTLKGSMQSYGTAWP